MIWNIHDLIFGTPDVNTAQLPLLGSPVPVWLLIAVYLWFVLRAGPAIMQRRSAFNLKYLLLSYNLLQIFINFAIFIYGVITILQHSSNITIDYGCIVRLPTDHPLKTLEMRYFYIYFLIKIVDLSETIFFVLRKSYKQISFLHVYHHVLMVLFNYYYLRYYGTGGHFISTGLLNTAVHGCMYTYYFATALRPHMKHTLRWKKYITQLQLLQFVLICCHQLYPLIYRPHCEFPRLLSVFGVVQASHMLWLFGQFYWRTYIRVSQHSQNLQKFQ